MSVDQHARQGADRPAKRRRRKRGLIAVLIVVVLLVVAGAVALATKPWLPDYSASRGTTQTEGNVRTPEDIETELRQCMGEVDPEAAKNRDFGAMLKASECLRLVDELMQAYAPLSEQEGQELVDQALTAMESAGLQRGQIPGALTKLNDTGLVGTFAGDRVAGLIGQMAESPAIEDYASGATDRDQAVEEIAEVVVSSERTASE